MKKAYNKEGIERSIAPQAQYSYSRPIAKYPTKLAILTGAALFTEGLTKPLITSSGNSFNHSTTGPFSPVGPNKS